MKPKLSHRLAAVSLALLLSAAPQASVHHQFLRQAFPAARSHLPGVAGVRLVFNGKADASFSSMKLLDAQGTLIAEMVQPKALPEMVLPTPPLPPGVYLLEYRVLASDGDVVKGDFFFTVDGQNS